MFYISRFVSINLKFCMTSEFRFHTFVSGKVSVAFRVGQFLTKHLL